MKNCSDARPNSSFLLLTPDFFLLKSWLNTKTLIKLLQALQLIQFSNPSSLCSVQWDGQELYCCY